MERAIVEALGEAGVTARPRSHEGREYTGVWAGERKIASIGVHISRGVSAHGFAVNVDNDLAPFTWVVACGLPSVAMTSVAQEGSPEGLACFRKRMAYRFAQAFGRRQRLITPQRLGIAARRAGAARAGRYAGPVSEAPLRIHQTRSRANPGGMDVTKVLGAGHAAVPQPQAVVVQGAAPGRPEATASSTR